MHRSQSSSVSDLMGNVATVRANVKGRDSAYVMESKIPDPSAQKGRSNHGDNDQLARMGKKQVLEVSLALQSLPIASSQLQ